MFQVWQRSLTVCHAQVDFTVTSWVPLILTLVWMTQELDSVLQAITANQVATIHFHDIWNWKWIMQQNGQAVVKIIHEESLKHMFLMESEIKFHIVLFREFAVISILMVDIYYCRCKRQHPHSCHHQWNRRSLSPRLLLPTADRGPHPLPQWNLQGYIPGGQEGWLLAM